MICNRGPYWYVLQRLAASSPPARTVPPITSPSHLDEGGGAGGPAAAAAGDALDDERLRSPAAQMRGADVQPDLRGSREAGGEGGGKAREWGGWGQGSGWGVEPQGGGDISDSGGGGAGRGSPYACKHATTQSRTRTQTLLDCTLTAIVTAVTYRECTVNVP